MTYIDRILAERYDRRGFMRMAGATTLGAAVLAACKKAEDDGTTTGTTGQPVSHPPIEQEPGDLAWALTGSTVGDTATLRILRGGVPREVMVRF